MTMIFRSTHYNHEHMRILLLYALKIIFRISGLYRIRLINTF